MSLKTHLLSQSNDECATCIVENITDCYFELSQLAKLEPSPVVNKLFERLVHLCSETPDESITTKVSATKNFATTVASLSCYR